MTARAVSAGTPGGVDTSIQFNNAGVFGGFGTWNGALLDIPGGARFVSTTEGLTIPAMTTLQRTALTDAAGLLVYDTDIGQLHQNDGATWSIPGAGLTTLQGAYDNDPTGAQILLDNVPNPLAIRAAVAGQIFVIQDIGGATDIFEFTDVQMAVRAPILFDVDLDAYLPANPTALFWNTDFTLTNTLIGGFIGSVGTVTLQNGTFIWGLLGEQRVYRTDVALGFAAYTFINSLPVFEAINPNNTALAALVMNVGVQHRQTTAFALTTGGCNGINFAPSLRTTVFGATVTSTGYNIAVCQPGWSTVFGSTINLGTVVGLRFNQPTQALFGTSAGVENITAYYGIQAFETGNTFGGANRIVEVIRSGLNSSTNSRFLNHFGNADSDLGGPLNFPNDFPNGVIRMGASNDFSCGYIGTSDEWYNQITTPATTQWRYAAPSANRLRMQMSAFANSEININVAKFSLGAQSGANGNQVGNFVTPARTIGVAGEWADFLLTQAGNLTVDGNNMSRVSAWVINGVSYASSSGTVTNADTLTVGGFPTSSPGVTITERQSLNVIGGRSRHQAAMQFDPINPAALASGATDDWVGLNTQAANNNMRHWARIEGNAAGDSSITGIDATAAQDGDTFKLTNVSANNVKIGHENVGSSAANRIITPDGQGYILGENDTVEIIYDGTSSRWRILTPPKTNATPGIISGTWQLDSSTTMADPGAGEFRNNNGTIGSVTSIAISDETKPGFDASNILGALASGDQLYVQNKEDADEFLVFDITGVTDNTTWFQIDGTVNASGSNFTSGKEFSISALFA